MIRIRQGTEIAWPHRFQFGPTNVRNRRNLVLAARSGEGLFSADFVEEVESSRILGIWRQRLPIEAARQLSA